MKFVPFLPTLHKFYIIILIHRQASHTLNIRTMDGESGEDDENDEPLNHAAGVKCGKNEGDYPIYLFFRGRNPFSLHDSPMTLNFDKFPKAALQMGKS